MPVTPQKRITIRMPDGSLFEDSETAVDGGRLRAPAGRPTEEKAQLPTRGKEAAVAGKQLGAESPSGPRSPSPNEIAAALVQAAEQAAAHGAIPDFAIVGGVEYRKPRKRR